jgi:hypothetical protein
MSFWTIGFSISVLKLSISLSPVAPQPPKGELGKAAKFKLLVNSLLFEKITLQCYTLVYSPFGG